MRLHGWCEKCRRLRLVRVPVPLPGVVQMGICDACEEAAKPARRP